jgi:predicted nucleic acid-binding protein
VSVLLDTNILARLMQPAHLHHPVASIAVPLLQQRGDELCVVPQNLYEFWVVATRPVTANGGLGMTPAAAQKVLDHFENLFALRPDTADVYPRWKALVTAHSTSGKASHDARLVAAMQTHGIDQILTFNTGDFSRYPGITVLDPAEIAPPGGDSP